MIGRVTILKGAVDGILQNGGVILELCEQVVDVVIVFHTAALVSQIYDGVHLLCNHGFCGIGKDACLGQPL